MLYSKIITIHSFCCASLSIVILGTTVFGQLDTIEERGVFQNQQRALRLVSLGSDIKSLADAPMRCFARTQIVKFIFESKVREYFGDADSFAFDCLDDIKKNSNEFSNQQSSYWKRTLIALLRQNSLAAVSIAEKKYFNAEDLSLSYLEAIDSGKNLPAITGRISSEILRGNIPADILSILDKLNRQNPKLYYQILNALLSNLESNPDPSGIANTLNFFISYYLDDAVPVETRRRFLRYSVNLAQIQLTKLETTELFKTSFDLLRLSLPKIGELAPTLYERATGVMLAMEGRITSANRDRNDAFRRIDESYNKLNQAISEAETAKSRSLSDVLWLHAFHLAVKEKKYRIAADSILKFGAGSDGSVLIRDNMLLNTLLPTMLNAKDLESIGYVLERIENVQNRGTGMLKIASKQIDLGDKVQAFESLEQALGLLSKVDVSADVVRISLSAVAIAMRIEKSNAFSTASSVIKMVNHLPTPSVDDKVGSPSRVKYTDTILLPTAFNLRSAFQVLARSDVDFAASIAQEIQQKYWRIVAGIVVETERKYELPEAAVQFQPPTH